MIVLDNSALIAALIDPGPAGQSCAARIAGASRIAAPAILDAEVVHALRGLLRGGKIDAPTADHAVAALEMLPVRRYPLPPLVARIWELKANATAYDAAYVALAEHLGVPLVTGDAKFSGIPRIRCSVETIR